jgi:hypothetical protein
MPIQPSVHDLSETKHANLIRVPKGWISKLPLVICVTLYIFHAYVIRKYAINLPFGDDWAVFAGGNHPASIDLDWLHAQHNEHRIATSKFMVWLQFQWNGWNYPVHLLINFLIYGLLLVCLVRFARKFTPLVPTWVVLGFIIFLLSPLNWINHFVALQLAFHFHLLFFFVACSCLCDRRQRLIDLLLACLAALLCIYSDAGGFVSIFVLLVAFCFFKGMRTIKSTGKERRRELFQLMLVFVIVGLMLWTWTIGYTTPPYHPPHAYPNTLRFWGVFLNLVSLGFGFQGISSGLGALCFLIVMTPICGDIWKRRHDMSRLQWVPYIAALAILANLAAISIGRAGFGVAVAKSDRYVELLTPLVVISAINWAVFLGHRKALQIAALMILWSFCFVGFANKWDFNVYRSPSAERLEGARCIKAYYEGVGDGRCPQVYPDGSHPEVFLEQAKRLNASFYRDLHVEAVNRHTHGLSSTHSYFDNLDVADCRHISGWAFDSSEPGTIARCCDLRWRLVGNHGPCQRLPP